MTNIPSGALIELKLPTNNQVTVANKAAGDNCVLRLDGTPRSMQCEARDQTVTWTTNVEINAYRSVQVMIEKAVNNPGDTEATETF